MKGIVNYNERSWAIDLIGHIKIHLAKSNRTIKDASGEQTLKTDGGSLFPDVLLFGDRQTARVLQGWELKLPDTPIDDYEFRHNAQAKALALGLDSFILWNVSIARLYVRTADTDNFTLNHQWDTLKDVNSRQSVMNERARWQALASEIIDYLNDLFDRGSLEGRQFVDAYKSGGITSLIMENSESVEEKLRDAANRNNILKAEIELWWLSYQLEYGQEKDKFSVLAQSNISNWIGKFLFAHILQARDERAQSVAQIKCSTSPDEALEIFKNLSEQCNFWTIFSDNVGLTSISEVTWDQLKQFNLLLSELRIGEIDQAQLSEVLEATVEVARRKLRGQYPTPSSLSQLLVRLCLQNKIDDKFIDPCCGSGTIARAALEIKLATDISPNAVASSIYASDLDAQALQIATFGLAKPALMHHPLKVFHQDAFELEPETEVTFRNPTDGSTFSEQLGEFNAICSNLPFVAQMGRKQFGNGIAGVNEVLGDDLGKLPSKSDIAAYLPFAFHSILKEEGRLGIIITNSWLGTDWGDVFFNRLCNFYKLKFVITSGAGRWFQNAAIVTNILILEKLSTDQVDLTNESIDFVVLQRPLQELEDVESNEQATAQIELGQSHGDTMTIRSVSFEKLEKFRIFGLAGNAQFVNCDWVLELPLASVRSLFNITRGMRRGWNDLFYPEKGHKIEDEYIEAVVKSPTEITGLTSSPKSQAFCCSHSISELEELGHHGAIEWISRFQDTVNTQGKPLTDVLATQGQLWYEMKASSMAEIVMSLGYGDRLFISRLNQPAFVDQRLIRVNSKDGVDLELCHALLNCTIGLFMIEGIGFGRGQGVLDLNKDRMEKFMHMLDPSQLNESSVLSIKEAFEPLLKREIFDVVDELEQPDRKHFDNTVLKAYGLNISREIICDSLLALLSIRQAATESV